MANENAILENRQIGNADSFDFNELETKLQNELDSQLSELEFSKEEKVKIGNPESLGNTIMKFLNQIATTAGMMN
jgi:hypothetical protein